MSRNGQRGGIIALKKLALRAGHPHFLLRFAPPSSTLSERRRGARRRAIEGALL